MMHQTLFDQVVSIRPGEERSCATPDLTTLKGREPTVKILFKHSTQTDTKHFLIAASLQCILSLLFTLIKLSAYTSHAAKSHFNVTRNKISRRLYLES